MEIKVLSRDLIKNYTTDKKHILIQIYCHGDYPEPTIKVWSRLDVLQLEFDDWDIRAKRLITEEFKDSAAAKKQIFFSEEQAQKIIEFVKKYIDKVELIICQCDAGISRSAGVAAALSKCINGNDIFFFENYLPNSLVYSTIVKEWNK